MKNKVILMLGVIVLVIGVIIAFRSQDDQELVATSLLTPNPRIIYTGAWIGGSWDSQSRILDTEKIREFENKIQNKLGILNIFSGWSYLVEPGLIENLKVMSMNGWTPMISSNPSFVDGCRSEKLSLYAAIADGTCDEFLRTIAKNLKSYNKPIFLRFAWEMNHPNMYWSVNKVNSTPDDFINAWRNFYKILKEEEANNVLWVLSFNTSNSNSVPYNQLYPGDDYVDWVAIDGYNWGTSKDWSGWTSFSGVFKKSYDELIGISNKPLMLSEVSTSSDGGNKSEWLNDMLAVQIPMHYPRVKAVVFFNEDKSKNEGVDWRVDNSPENIDAMKSALSNSLYKNSYP